MDAVLSDSYLLHLILDKLCKAGGYKDFTELGGLLRVSVFHGSQVLNCENSSSNA